MAWHQKGQNVKQHNLACKIPLQKCQNSQLWLFCSINGFGSKCWNIFKTLTHNVRLVECWPMRASWQFASNLNHLYFHIFTNASPCLSSQIRKSDHSTWQLQLPFIPAYTFPNALNTQIESSNFGLVTQILVCKHRTLELKREPDLKWT